MVCRQLGFSGGALNDGTAYPATNSTTTAEDTSDSGSSTGDGATTSSSSKKKKKGSKGKEEPPAGPPLLLSAVRCTGGEASLSGCSFEAPTGADCPDGGAGVVCT